MWLSCAISEVKRIREPARVKSDPVSRTPRREGGLRIRSLTRLRSTAFGNSFGNMAMKPEVTAMREPRITQPERPEKDTH
jgi:hypothetical protein